MPLPAEPPVDEPALPETPPFELPLFPLVPRPPVPVPPFGAAPPLPLDGVPPTPCSSSPRVLSTQALKARVPTAQPIAKRTTAFYSKAAVTEACDDSPRF